MKGSLFVDDFKVTAVSYTHLSLDKKFRTAKKYKTKTVTTKKVTYTVKKLTKKKKYYFRIRGVNGKTYGSWSKAKKVSIKK